MALMVLKERRSSGRIDIQRKIELKIPAFSERLRAYSLNFSEAGVCMRTEESLDVKTSVRLRMFMNLRKKPLECSGKIAWVVQRLDLRSAPPFLYDVGVEFINPPLLLREFMAKSLPLSGSAQHLTQSRKINLTGRENFSFNGRIYEPHIDKNANDGSWHLVVVVEGAPCFSRHFFSMKEALKSWQDFKNSLANASSKSVKRTKKR